MLIISLNFSKEQNSHQIHSIISKSVLPIPTLSMSYNRARRDKIVQIYKIRKMTPEGIISTNPTIFHMNKKWLYHENICMKKIV